jgi:hypothetical protein
LGAKIGQARGPQRQVFVLGVEMRPNPKAVAGPPSRARTKYGPIFAATLRAAVNFPRFVVACR